MFELFPSNNLLLLQIYVTTEQSLYIFIFPVNSSLNLNHASDLFLLLSQSNEFQLRGLPACLFSVGPHSQPSC